jgi:hypothetical protein
MFDVDRWFQISKMLVLLAESDVTVSYVPRNSQRPLADPPPEFLGLRTPPPICLGVEVPIYTKWGVYTRPHGPLAVIPRVFLACHFADV